MADLEYDALKTYGHKNGRIRAVTGREEGLGFLKRVQARKGLKL